MRSARAWWTSLLLAAAGPSAVADGDGAEEHRTAARAALERGEWKDAEALFRKALVSAPADLGAHVGLANALLGAGRVEEGLKELRAAVDGSKKAPDAEPKDVLDAARARLARIDEAAPALAAIVDRYVERLLQVAEKWREKDPGLAAISFERVLRLRPAHAKATAGLAALGRSARGTFQPLFNGRDSSGWTGVGKPIWEVASGEVRADSPNVNSTCSTVSTYRGDFDVRMEAKLIEQKGDTPVIALLTGLRPTNEFSAFGIWTESVKWFDRSGADAVPSSFEVPWGTLDPPLDPAAWNQYEIRFEGNRAEMWINGKQVGEIERPPNRGDGSIGILCQHCKAAFRKIEVLPR